MDSVDTIFEYAYLADTPENFQDYRDIYRFDGKIVNYKDTRSDYFTYDHNCNYPGYEGL